MTEKFRTVVLAGLVGAVVLLGAGCSAEDPTPPGLAEPTGTIPVQQVDPRLRDRLPAHIKQSGSLVAVNSGAFPPYELIQPDGTVRGASADLLNAIGQLWGIDIKHATVDGLSGLLAGIASERYQLGFGPSGDFKERQQRNDFIDYVQEFVVFGVPAGNPKNITGLKSTCGMRIAVQAGGSAEAVIEKQQQTCLRAGQPPVQVMSFKDHPQSILSVLSHRSDAFFSSRAPLSYFARVVVGRLELAGTGESNGFGTLYQGAIVKKGSELGPLLRDSLHVLFANGTYGAVMKKWGVEANKLAEPGMNLAKA